jgi:hypothetical protein
MCITQVSICCEYGLALLFLALEETSFSGMTDLQRKMEVVKFPLQADAVSSD